MIELENHHFITSHGNTLFRQMLLKEAKTIE